MTKLKTVMQFNNNNNNNLQVIQQFLRSTNTSCYGYFAFEYWKINFYIYTRQPYSFVTRITCMKQKVIGIEGTY